MESPWGWRAGWGLGFSALDLRCTRMRWGALSTRCGPCSIPRETRCIPQTLHELLAAGSPQSTPARGIPSARGTPVSSWDFRGTVQNHQHCPKPTRLRNEGSPSNRRAGQGPRGTQPIRVKILVFLSFYVHSFFKHLSGCWSINAYQLVWIKLLNKTKC